MAVRQFGAKLEARAAIRRTVDLECEVYAELWGEPIAHRVTDVSENGLWIQADLLLELGSEVTLTFFPPEWDEPLCVAGRVCRVDLRVRPGDGNAVGMGIEFEALRRDERRRLRDSMRCLRPQDSFILDQKTLSGVPVAATGRPEPVPHRGGTLAGWAAPNGSPSYVGRPSHITARPPRGDEEGDEGRRGARPSDRAFAGGLDLAASVFSSGNTD